MRRYGSRGLLAAVATSVMLSTGFAQDALFGEGQDPDLRVEVRDLKRGDGGVVTLRLRLVNGSASAYDASCDMRDPAFNDFLRRVHRRLSARCDQQEEIHGCARLREKVRCSAIAAVEPGKKTNIWATFPAPPAEVSEVTVVVPLFEPIEGVPIN